MSSTTFESRLARLAEERPASQTMRSETPEPISEPTSSGPNVLKLLFLMPIAAALGAAAVVAGGFFQVTMVEGGIGPDTVIPPQLGPAAFAIAFILSFVIDKIMGGRIAAPLAVTVGFVAMMWGEPYLAQMYPEIWSEIYNVKNLSPVHDLYDRLRQ